MCPSDSGCDRTGGGYFCLIKVIRFLQLGALTADPPPSSCCLIEYPLKAKRRWDSPVVATLTSSELSNLIQSDPAATKPLWSSTNQYWPDCHVWASSSSVNLSVFYHQVPWLLHARTHTHTHTHNQKNVNVKLHKRSDIKLINWFIDLSSA